MKKGTEASLAKAIQKVKEQLYIYKATLMDLEWLEAGGFRFLAENLLVTKGVIPPGWDHVLNCKHCGDVPYDLLISEQVEGCVWCLGRK